MFELHAKVADLVAGLDEGAADIMGADDAELEWNVGLLRIANGRWRTGIGDRNHQICFDRAFDSEFSANLLANGVDGLAVDNRIRPREIDMLEDAGPRSGFGKWMMRLDAFIIHNYMRYTLGVKTNATTNGLKVMSFR